MKTLKELQEYESLLPHNTNNIIDPFKVKDSYCIPHTIKMEYKAKRVYRSKPVYEFTQLPTTAEDELLRVLHKFIGNKGGSL